MSREDKENPSYITVMRGVGIFQAVLMAFSRKEQEYQLSRTFKAYKTGTKALEDAEEQGRKLGLDVRL